MPTKPKKIMTANWNAASTESQENRSRNPASEPLAVAAARALVDAGAPTCVTDIDGNVIYANDAYERIADAFEEAGIAPARVRSNTKPGSEGIATETLATIQALNGPLEREHSLIIDGRNEHFLIHRKPLLNDAGKCYAAASIFERITERKTSDATLAQANERLEDITRLVSDWIWETNRNLVMTFVSPRINEALGYHQLEMIGRRLTDLFIHPNNMIESLGTTEGRRPFRDIEVEINDRQGRSHYVLLSGLPVYCPTTGSFLGFRGTANDITDLRSREGALLKSKEAAELANRTKSEFLANMSHELRTPLNAIIGFSDIMSGEMLGSLGNDQYKGYSKDISDSAKHLLVLINEILDSAKIEAGELSLYEETVDPVALAQSVQRLISTRAERAGIDLQVRVNPGIPPLYADKTKLKQILINLISNAVKFTPEGGSVELRAEVADSGQFIFMVSDTGIGIAAEDIPQALAPFGQVDSRLSRKYEGTGLGLPLAKSLTELHSGVFQIVSQPGVGTTVTIRLPAARVVRA